MESMLEHAATSATVPTEAEAYQTLLARAHRKTGAVPAELVVRHVLSVTGDADWPVRREALEALLRRIAFGKADGLQIVSRPAAVRALIVTKKGTQVRGRPDDSVELGPIARDEADVLDQDVVDEPTIRLLQQARLDSYEELVRRLKRPGP